MNRLFLYSGFLFILILIFDAYDRDYNLPQTLPDEIGDARELSKGDKKPPKDAKQSVKQPIPDTALNQEDIRSIQNQKLFINLNQKLVNYYFQSSNSTLSNWVPKRVL